MQSARKSYMHVVLFKPEASNKDVMLSCADKAMAEVFGAHYVSLHVRVTNQAAYHLYRETLGYE